MPIVKIISITICAALALTGVTFIYDARRITKKVFSFGDQNESTKILKICGFIVAVIASLIILSICC